MNRHLFTPAQERLVQACTALVDDPEAFVAFAYADVTPRRWQRRAFRAIRRAIDRGRRHLQVHVRSCHGAGKTFFAAALLDWWMTTRIGARGLTTAPTWRQVEGAIWPEVHDLHSKSVFGIAHFGEVQATKLRFSRKWYADGASSDRPENLEGLHSTVAACRFVDEAKAVPRNVYVATRGLLQAPESLDVWTSTPWLDSGSYYDRDVRGGADVIRIVVTIDDLIAEGIPGMKEWDEESRRDWGEDSPEYRARAKAEYVSGVEGALFPLTWIERAMKNPWTLAGEPDVVSAAGQDFAGSVDGDQNAFVELRTDGERIELAFLDAWHERNTLISGRKAKEYVRARRIPTIVGDAQGVGKGATDDLLEQADFSTVEWYGSAKADDRLRYANLKTEWAFFLRDKFEKDLVKLLPRRRNAKLADLPELLKTQLCGYVWKPLPGGQKKLVDPEDSPDLGDAFIMAASGLAISSTEDVVHIVRPPRTVLPPA